MATGSNGRPLKFKEPTVPVTVRIPASTHDRLCQEAQRRGADLRDHIRARLGVSYSKVDSDQRDV